MWYDTVASRLLGITYPIIQGPFGGGPSSVELVAAVSDGGGLGSFGMHTLVPDEMRGVAAQIRSATKKPFALNLWVDDAPRDRDAEKLEFDAAVRVMQPFFIELGMAAPEFPQWFIPSLDDQYAAILEIRPPVFSFVFGIPPVALLRECRRLGIATMGTATTATEAKAIEAAGVDIVVASAFEAGGHKGSFLKPAGESLTGGFALIPQVADAVRIPVIAAGGITDGRGVAAALMLGAHGVQVGTAFLACDESAASGAHRAALFGNDSMNTLVTDVVTGRIARHIPGVFIKRMEQCGARPAPYPLQAWLNQRMKSAALAQCKPEYLSFPAGQAAPLLRHSKAAELLEALVEETAVLLHGKGGNSGSMSGA
jgi:nitronate monooxygenase